MALQLQQGVTLERGFRIPHDVRIIDFVRNRLYYPDMLTSNLVMVVSVEKERVSFGFNVMSAVIMESLLEGQSKEDAIVEIVSVFDQNAEQVERDYQETMEFLVDKRIIQ